jgi:hypothetical protein
MNDAFSFPMLAELGKPELFGKVAPRDPTLADNPWFWAGAAFLAVIIALAVYYFIRNRREKRLEKARKDPVFILRTRLELLRQTTDQAGTTFFTELASIMRNAIGLCYEMSATPRTARELEQLLVGRECANRAGAALVVITECEAVLCSGNEPTDRAELLIKSVAAFNELLPDSAAKLKEGKLAL